jgi:hypothetical protein
MDMHVISCFHKLIQIPNSAYTLKLAQISKSKPNKPKLQLYLHFLHDGMNSLQ